MANRRPSACPNPAAKTSLMAMAVRKGFESPVGEFAIGHIATEIGQLNKEYRGLRVLGKNGNRNLEIGRTRFADVEKTAVGTSVQAYDIVGEVLGAFKIHLTAAEAVGIQQGGAHHHTIHE